MKRQLYQALDRLIGKRRGWVLFYQSQYGEGWARRTAAGITLWHQSKLAAGGTETHTITA